MFMRLNPQKIFERKMVVLHKYRRINKKPLQNGAVKDIFISSTRMRYMPPRACRIFLQQ